MSFIYKFYGKQDFFFNIFFPECLQLHTMSSIFNIASTGAISCYTRLISSTFVLWHHVFYGCLLFYFDADCGKCFSGRHSRRKYYFSIYLMCWCCAYSSEACHGRNLFMLWHVSALILFVFVYLRIVQEKTWMFIVRLLTKKRGNLKENNNRLALDHISFVVFPLFILFIIIDIGLW